MPHCPQCQAELSDWDVHNGRCSACGHQIVSADADPLPEESQSDTVPIDLSDRAALHQAEHERSGQQQAEQDGMPQGAQQADFPSEGASAGQSESSAERPTEPTTVQESQGSPAESDADDQPPTDSTMMQCVHCGAGLTADQVAAGTCPQCGLAVTAGSDSGADEAAMAATFVLSESDADAPGTGRESGRQQTLPQCIHCGAALDQADVQAGICPGCGKPISEPETVDDTMGVDESEAAGLGTLPMDAPAEAAGTGDTDLTTDSGSEGKDDAAPGAGDTDMTVISDVFDEQAQADAQAATQMVEPAEPSQPGQGEPAGKAAFDAKESSELLETLASAWDNVDSNDLPTMSIRARELHSASASSTLVIKSKHFASTDKPAWQTGADYELINVLGEGGMGVVFDARQTCIDRSVAIKLLKPKIARDAKNRDKFLAEAVVTGELDHPNIVPIYELGTNDKGALFYSMKHVEGTPWKDVIGQKSLQENLEILLRVADAIAFAHARGVLHRDIKPENVMLGDFGEVLVMDWGLAQPTRSFRKARSIADIRSMGGTPAYMAPEMATGPFEKIGPHSDIYLLGAVLYEIVTGYPPHTGKSAAACLVAAAKNEIRPTDKSGELLDIALKAMAEQPEDRYASVTEFQSAVRDYISHAESILLSQKAAEQLQKAQQSGDYQDYQAAVYGFQQALELWDGNAAAQQRLSEARLAYAEWAMRKGDLELAGSLLDADKEEHAPLLRDIRVAQKEREAHARRLKNARRLMGALAALLFISVTTGLFVVKGQRDRAVKAEHDARIAAQKEYKARLDAEAAKEQERQAKEEAQRLADENLALAEQEREAKEQEAQARQDEEKARKKAQEAAVIAQRAKQAEEYEAYVARIGFAAAKIDENAFEAARNALLAAAPRYRGWEWGRLMHLASLEDATFSAGTVVEALALSPDGRYLVTGGAGGKARLWDTSTKQIVHELPHQGRTIYAVAFSPDGRTIATGSDDPTGYIKLWDAQTGKPLRTDGFGGGPQKTESGREEQGSVVPAVRSTAHTAPVTSLAFSHDGKRLLSGSFDHTARLWDVETGRQIRRFWAHTWWVWSVAFCPEFDAAGNRVDETRLLTASQDGTVIVWTDPTASWTDDANVRQGNRFFEHQGPVFAAAFTPDGKFILSGGFDRRVLLWDPGTVPEDDLKSRVLGRPRPKTPVTELLGHTGAVRSVDVSQDGKLAVTCGHDNTVKVWDLRSAVAAHAEGLQQLTAQTPAASALETDKALRVWNVPSQHPVTGWGHSSWARACRFSPDGIAVYSGGYDNTVKRWSLKGKPELIVLQGREFEGHNDAVLAAEFSGDGRTIVTASRDRTARIWNVESGRELATLREGHDFLASNVLFYPDGRRLLTAAIDNTVRVWDLASGTELFRLKGTGRSAAVALSSDGAWILTGSAPESDGETEQFAAQLWDAQTGRHIARLQGHRHEITAIAFSPADSRIALTGDFSGRCLLWDVSKGRILARLYGQLSGHTGKVVAAAFLPDGQWALTASDDKTVAFWNLQTGQEDKSRMLKHPEGVTAMALAPDGRQLLTASADGIIRQWDVPTARLIRDWKLNGSVKTLAANLQRELDRRDWTASELSLRAGIAEDRILDVLAGRVDPYDPNVQELAAAVGRSVESLLRPVASALALSPSGHALAVDPADGTVHVWNLQTGETLLRRQHEGEVWSAAFSPDEDGSRVAVVGGTAAIVWDVQTGGESVRLTPHGVVASAAMSPDGRFVVTAGWDGSARLWEAATGRAILKLEGVHRGAIYRALFSPDPDRRLVLTCGEDGRAVLWQLPDDPTSVSASMARPIREYRGHEAAVRYAAFSPDGRYIVTASDDRTAAIWDAKSTGSQQNPEAGEPLGQGASPAVLQKPLCRLEGHGAAVLCAEFSTDGTRVITGAGAGDHTARVWKLEHDNAGRWQATLETVLLGHTASVTSVAFSPGDAGRASTATRDYTVKLWDIAGPATDAAIEAEGGAVIEQPADNQAARPRQAKEVLTLRGHRHDVTSVRFSPDGKSVLTAGEDGRVILWPAADWQKPAMAAK